MGAKVKDQCKPVRKGAWGRGYFSPQDSIFITLRPQEVKSNAVYCTQHTCVIILYVYVYTCPTSVHVSPHDTYVHVHTVHVYLNFKTEFNCCILFSHVHSSPHISFITTFTSKMKACKFPHSLYLSTFTCT